MKLHALAQACKAEAGAVGVLTRAPRRHHSTSAAAEAPAIAPASLAGSLSAAMELGGRSFAGQGPLHGCPGMAGPERRGRRRAAGRWVPSARPCLQVEAPRQACVGLYGRPAAGAAPSGVSKGATRRLERRRNSVTAQRPQRSPLRKGQPHEDPHSLIACPWRWLPLCFASSHSPTVRGRRGPGRARQCEQKPM